MGRLVIITGRAQECSGRGPIKDETVETERTALWGLQLKGRFYSVRVLKIGLLS